MSHKDVFKQFFDLVMRRRGGKTFWICFRPNIKKDGSIDKILRASYSSDAKPEVWIPLASPATKPLPATTWFLYLIIDSYGIEVKSARLSGRFLLIDRPFDIQGPSQLIK